ncbi:MAG: hypothetical protein H0X29_08940 [Parachlamydiaceae bacterium]|nr:hypothetical protein [Parachlamydiaceae bacterium]
MMTFAKVSRRPEFDRDLKQLLKRYRSLEDDLTVFINTQLVLLHKQKIDNRGIVLINNLGIEEPKIFKPVKFACKSIHGRGAASGIRLTYAYFEEADHIEFIQIYFKADDENEDLEDSRLCCFAPFYASVLKSNA